MAPPGKHIMSCFIQYTPYELADSDWDGERENLGDTVQATLESYFPGFGDLILYRDVVTPLDIERKIGLSEGNIFAGEFLTPQDVPFSTRAGVESVSDSNQRLLPMWLRHPPRRRELPKSGGASALVGALVADAHLVEVLLVVLLSPVEVADGHNLGDHGTGKGPLFNRD